MSDLSDAILSDAIHKLLSGAGGELNADSLNMIAGICGGTMRIILETAFPEQAQHIRIALMLHVNHAAGMPGANSMLKGDFRNPEVLAEVLESHARELRRKLEVEVKEAANG